jgi:hypothetical protein
MKSIWPPPNKCEMQETIMLLTAHSIVILRQMTTVFNLTYERTVKYRKILSINVTRCSHRSKTAVCRRLSQQSMYFSVKVWFISEFIDW